MTPRVEKLDDVLGIFRHRLRREEAPDAAVAEFLSRVETRGVEVEIGQDVGREVIVDPPAGAAAVVSWRNVRFHWVRIAAAAGDVAGTYCGAAHSPAYWITKAFQVFLQLHDVLKRPLGSNAGLVYWALWCYRNPTTKLIDLAKIPAALKITFDTWSRPVPSEEQLAAALQELEAMGCVRRGETAIELREEVQVKL